MLARILLFVVASGLACAPAVAQREMSPAEVRRHNEMVLRLKKKSNWHSGTAPTEPARPVLRAPDGRQYVPPVEKTTVLLVSKSSVVVQRRDGARYRIYYRGPKGTLDFLPHDIALIHSPGSFGGRGSFLFLSRAFQHAQIVKTERLR